MLITFSTPLPSALTRFWTATSGSTSSQVHLLPSQIFDGLHREIGVDGGGAETHQQGDVMHLADIAGLDHETHLGSRPLADQVVVDGAGQQQRGDRRDIGCGVPI